SWFLFLIRWYSGNLWYRRGNFWTDSYPRSVMLYQKPQSHTMWGVIILILSIIAFPAAWGFGIGSLLAFIGAILALVYKPSMGPAMMPSQPMGAMPMGSMGSGQAMGSMGMTCKNCGASIHAGATRCPSFGATVEAATFF